MEAAETLKTLGHFPVGSRLLIRSKKDWRFAVVCRKTDEYISLSVASPTGYNYRLKRPADLELFFDGQIPYLAANASDHWRDNFSPYDPRW
ncbi:MAG: hypothetical protein AB7F88_03835 [Pyrinomonadaceae bacterium]